MTSTIQAKSIKRKEVEESLEETKVNYDAVKEELKSFTDGMSEVEQEFKDVHSNLSDIEILHCIKTSPENVDDLRDRPQSVKIARSLRQRISSRRLGQNYPQTTMQQKPQA